MSGRIAYYGGIVTNGLVLDLDAGKRDSYPGSGTVWNDVSGFRNNGTLVNGPTFNSANGGSIVFDGIDDYSSVPNFNYGRTGFSVESWFRYNVYSTSGYKSGIVTKWKIGSGTSNEFLLGTEGAGGSAPYWPFFTIQGDNNVFYSAQDTSIIQVAGVWYHQVGTFDGTRVRLYVNGVLRKTTPPIATNTVKTQADQQIGIASFGSSFQFRSPCDIPIARLYSQALSDTEVLQNYNATKSRFGL